MAGEKESGSQPSNAGGGNANKGQNRNNSNNNSGNNSSNNNRRRSLRSKRRARKPEEANEPRETRAPRDAREPREARLQPPQPKSAEKNVRDNRDRRRRRRMRAKQRGQNEIAAPVVEDTFKDLPPFVPAFVYTHVLRPAMRDSFEFRTEHFSKVTRKLEDFHIDLSPLYPDGGDEIKGVAYMPPVTDRPDYGDEDEEGYDDADWDAEQSDDAARLEGAIADDFYDDLNDSVLDDSPEEDIDA
jgi:hypothetical protein